MGRKNRTGSVPGEREGWKKRIRKREGEWQPFFSYVEWKDEKAGKTMPRSKKGVARKELCVGGERE